METSTEKFPQSSAQLKIFNVIEEHTDPKFENAPPLIKQRDSNKYFFEKNELNHFKSFLQDFSQMQ